jgi:hypothetical protein
MQLSPFSRHLNPLRSKYPPQHPVLKHPVFRDPALYKLLTFQVPNLISIFHSLGRLSKESVLVRGS